MNYCGLSDNYLRKNSKLVTKLTFSVDSFNKVYFQLKISRINVHITLMVNFRCSVEISPTSGLALAHTPIIEVLRREGGGINYRSVRTWFGPPYLCRHTSDNHYENVSKYNSPAILPVTFDEKCRILTIASENLYKMNNNTYINNLSNYECI